MYLVYTTYDDGYIDILDTSTRDIKRFTNAEAANFGTRYDVLGLSVSNGKINYANTYGFMQFNDDYEMEEYIRENSISFKEYTDGYWCVFFRTNNYIHVDYVIWHYAEVEVKYIAEKGTTAYLEYAKVFDKNTAYKVCAQRNKALAKRYNMSECGYWSVRKVQN